MFGIDRMNPTTPSDFIDSYRQALDRPRHTMIEVTTDRQENYNFHQLLP
jgi:thiamine pyrophosphate-dependent acetolactate synthase large subunit-like protein